MFPFINAELIFPILSGVLVLLLFWIIRLEWKLYRFTRGRAGRSLEESIIELLRNERELQSFRKEMEEYLTQVEKRLKRSIQSVATIRFNPFKGTGDGGNQSFTTAFLSEDGDGVVLSTLHARERMSIFSKQLSGFTSPHDLSEEEKEAISKARGSIGGN